MIYVTAYKENKPTIFISCTEDWLVRISDLLFDHGYLIGQCAKWYYEQCMAGNSDDDTSECLFYELDDEVEETDLSDHLVDKLPPFLSGQSAIFPQL